MVGLLEAAAAVEFDDEIAAGPEKLDNGVDEDAGGADADVVVVVAFDVAAMDARDVAAVGSS